jgi:hypothetical protein
LTWFYIGQNQKKTPEILRLQETERQISPSFLSLPLGSWPLGAGSDSSLSKGNILPNDFFIYLLVF